MIEKIRELYKKYEELILYVFFGGCTTVVNIVVYGLCADVAGIHYLVSNFLAWILSVIFAYITNRKWVFKSKGNGFAALLKEFSLFVGARVMSLAGDMLIMYVCVSLLHLPGMIAKILANIFVVIFNYIFSKFIIFKK